MTQGRFNDRVAVVTGAADGIGRAIAERIAAEGGKVAIWDIKEELLKKREAELKEAGKEVLSEVLDVSDEQAVKNAFERVVETYGKVDIVVNSAGIVGPTQTKITDYPTSAFEQTYKVNLLGSFLICKHALAHMEKENYGRILLIASIAGKEGNPFMSGYSATKAGVIGLVKGLGKEYAHTGITVNGIAPAVVRTPMNADTDPKQLEYMASKIPMQRLGTVEEAASLATWVVSEEASFNTAFVFDLSGGRATY